MNTKKIFLTLIGAYLFVALHAQTNSTERFIGELTNFLRAEGFKPERYEDGVTFNYDGNIHYVFVEWEDPLFFVEFRRRGYSLVGEYALDRDYSILICNEINKDMVAVKLYCIEESVIFNIEQYTRTFENFKNVFKANLEKLAEADEEFWDMYQELTDDTEYDPEPYAPNANTEWYDMLKQAVSSNPTNTWEDGDKYKGQSRTNGLGVYLWDNGDIYFGNSKENRRNGYGVYVVMSDIILNCPDCKYYAGNWSNGIKSGEGFCYDASGNLLYFGEFKENKPQGGYPSTGTNFDPYKFAVKDYDNGKYIGQTKNGKKQGYGLYIFNNGDIWFGWWKDDTRDGAGITIFNSGTLQTGNWKGNERR